MTETTINYDDIKLLTAWMAEHGYTAANIAEAVDKPWHWTDELALAKDRAKDGRPPADEEDVLNDDHVVDDSYRDDSYRDGQLGPV
jgi:hypothetical protein